MARVESFIAGPTKKVLDLRGGAVPDLGNRPDGHPLSLVRLLSGRLGQCDEAADAGNDEGHANGGGPNPGGPGEVAVEPVSSETVVRMIREGDDRVPFVRVKREIGDCVRGGSADLGFAAYLDSRVKMHDLDAVLVEAKGNVISGRQMLDHLGVDRLILENPMSSTDVGDEVSFFVLSAVG